MRIPSFILRHRVAAGLVAVVAVALLAFVLVWFQPHKLLIDATVNEALPRVESEAGNSGSSGKSERGEERGSGTPSSSKPPKGPKILASGAFRGLEHASSGTALVVELPDMARYLRFEDLNTSNGPDLRVYLSVLPPNRGWYDYDDAHFVDLGALKGNRGNQNYAIPKRLDVSRYKSAVIWCRRFSVGFAVAPIA